MDPEKLRTILQIGETIAVEFKRCSNRIENDVYQSVCSFLNRFGGDIYLGVEDDGTVCGVPENAAGDMVKNFIKIISNPNMFTPTIYLEYSYAAEPPVQFRLSHLSRRSEPL